MYLQIALDGVKDQGASSVVLGHKQVNNNVSYSRLEVGLLCIHH